MDDGVVKARHLVVTTAAPHESIIMAENDMARISLCAEDNDGIQLVMIIL